MAAHAQGGNLNPYDTQLLYFGVKMITLHEKKTVDQLSQASATINRQQKSCFCPSFYFEN